MSKNQIKRTDKAFHIYKHLNGLDNCLSDCFEECFKTIGLASTAYDLLIKKLYTSFGKLSHLIFKLYILVSIFYSNRPLFILNLKHCEPFIFSSQVGKNLFFLQSRKLKHFFHTHFSAETICKIGSQGLHVGKV